MISRVSVLIFGIWLGSVSILSAQETSRKTFSHSYLIDVSRYPVFDETGQRRNPEEVNELLANGTVSVRPLYGLDGRTERLLLTPYESRIDEVDMGGQPKAGEQIADYIFENLDGKVYALSEMRDQYVILFMNLTTQKPFYQEDAIKRLEQAIDGFPEKEKVVPLMLFAAEDADNQPYEYFQVLKFGNAFRKLMNVRSFPLIFVIGKNGIIKAVWSKDDAFDLSVLLK